ncbi:MAG: PD40 domain-containing protein [Deltaproteobacteria bacterium]|nr:PD40 domain-containing protein [Deltaproteobacteria bacterium]
MRLPAVVLVAALVVPACGKQKSGGGDASTDYERIELEPGQATLTVALGGVASQDYKVFGVSGDVRTEITPDCLLAIDPSFGSAAAASVTVGARGGKTSVAATCGARVGEASLIVNLTGKIIVGTGTPANAADLFDAATLATDPGRTSATQYPLDKAVSPRNIPPIEMQWTAAGNDLFHLHITASFTAIDVYTSDLEATLGAAEWTSLANTAAGGLMQIGLEGLAQAAPTTKFTGAGVSLTMSNDDIDKTAIYWWASSQGNIMSQVFGTTTPPSLVKDDCTSCHSVSRSGSRIGYSRCVGGSCSDLWAGFLKYDALAGTWNEAVNANSRVIPGTYSTFSPIGNPFPTDEQSVAIVALQGGTLGMYDPDTGAAVASNLDVATHGSVTPRSATMPDWSADGMRVVFASTPNPGQSIDISQSSIATMTYQYTNGTHVFGEPQFPIPNPITLPSGTYDNHFFPSFSPDGALIVFNAARAAWRNFTDARTPGQRLMLADATGAWVTDLAALNGGGDTDITWAHWAPGAANDYYWVVFASQRDYGHRATEATANASCVRNGVRQCKQIWIGAIAKNKLTGVVTMDPSAPPMWLPGQDVNTVNISPYWTKPTIIQ